MWPWIVCGEESIANDAASEDSKVTLIQCSPIATRFTLNFSSFVKVRCRNDDWSRRSDLYFRCSAAASRG